MLDGSHALELHRYRSICYAGHPRMTPATAVATMRHEPIFRSIAVRTVTVLTAAALVVLIGAFAGGFVSGLAGFGTGLVALGIWLHVIQPTTAATLVVVCSVVSQATGTTTGSSRYGRAVSSDTLDTLDALGFWPRRGRQSVDSVQSVRG